MSKTQLGDRIPTDIVDTLGKLSEYLHVPRQQLTEDAIASWMGKKDPLARVRHEMAIKAFKSGKVERPFENSLTLLESNAAVV